MLGAWYWFHHNLVAAPGNSVGSKDDVMVVPSPPLTAVERAGKLGVVNQAQSLIICLVLYSSPSVLVVARETFTWRFVDRRH